MAARPARPPALLLTCVLVGVGSGLLLVNLVSALGSWGSIALQDAVRDALAQEPASELGISVDQALEALRYAAYVGVALAASGLVFAVYTARGHRTSRVMLTVLLGLAFLLFAALGLPGLLPALFAGISAWSLWTPDARRWFDQVDGRAVPAAAAAATPARHDPFAAPRPTPADAPAAGVVPGSVDPAPADPSVPTPGGARPRPVRIAVVTTVAACALVGTFGLLALLVSTLGADAYRSALDQPGTAQDLLRSSGIDADELIDLLRISSTVWLALSAAGLAAALAAARRVAAGAVALQVVCAVTIAVSAFFLPLGVVTAGAAIVVLVQLRRPEARAWYAGA